MANGEYAWASEPEKEFFKQAVRGCLEEPRLRELLERRPEVTPEAVAEAMCSSPYVERVLGSGKPTPHHSSYRDFRRYSDRYHWALPAYLSLREIKQNADFQPWRVGAVAYWAVTLFLMYAGNSPYLFPGVPFLLFTVPALAFVRRVVPSSPPTGTSPRWFPAVRLALLAPVTSVLWLAEWASGLAWATELHREGLQKQVARAVEDLIGEDLGTLLVTSGHEGLRSHHQTSYFVDNRSTDELRQKMDQLADGTIALSGPRGVGKTTLIRSAVRPGDFSVFTHAPASYAPHDFLTSMFVSVCRQYIVRAGHEAPELVRLSYAHRVRRRVAGPLSGLLRLLPYALPAAGLLCLGMFAATKESIEAPDGLWGWQYVDSGIDRATGFVRDVTDGSAPQAALLIAIAGALLWQLRRSSSFSWLAKRLSTAVVAATTAALLVSPVVSFFLDPDLRHHFDSPPDAPSRSAKFLSVLYLTSVMGAGLGTLYYRYVPIERVRLRVGTWSVSLKRLLRPLVVLIPFLLLAWIVAAEPLRPILTDDETPFRLGAFLLGLLLYRVTRRSRPILRSTPRLVTACRNHLYRLQTVQSSTAAMTTGATQLLALGGTHTGALTSVPPNYPVLVSEFRALLGTIAKDEHRKGNRVVIAIDEVDRLGTDTQALAFLAEIKAILGVSHVHYLISVAEDVGAAFVRRGLPSRDVTDSSLDDVLHVRPCTLDESTRILLKRAQDIGEAYIALAHTLSGGIPRDLIRYGRRLMKIQTTTEQRELSDVAQALIIEELSETLSGFRTLLAKQQWKPDTAGVLRSFRSLAAHLRAACPCPEPADQLRGALGHFAAYEVVGLPEESGRLIDEATAYAYFSLTLLDVFGRPDFNRRRATAARRPDGHLDLLAEARQELAVSPYSARAVVDGIRAAWELEPVSARGPQPTVVIPPPRGTACAVHHSIT
ncbi:hypothetical protein QQY66_35955 [Streptomyces sp. DG2A-72]|uniref:hypothetical protein n=1 Tax=Streptomyces sp. DG2A-72 TaxID=3051386 RepID=UPI00265C3020|nr:hypothetical protein [Streptomyces sp. DG2A-72]MDO0936850.1 hypothetical protein [Streptomyces sp. DG2A-72]